MVLSFCFAAFFPGASIVVRKVVESLIRAGRDERDPFISRYIQEGAITHFQVRAFVAMRDECKAQGRDFFAPYSADEIHGFQAAFEAQRQALIAPVRQQETCEVEMAREGASGSSSPTISGAGSEVTIVEL